jgi:mannose-6-phosphate isomerase-like protein (cupin superfamily)
MARFIEKATVIQAAGTPSKDIGEFVGRVSSGTNEVSIAKMVSPQSWQEPAQAPEFNEYTLVLRGALHVRLKDREVVVRAGQAIVVNAGETVQYSTPEPGGAEYVAVCVPAFSPQTVHRDTQAAPQGVG